MNPDVLYLFLGGVAAGTFGAMFGLGGGVLIVPFLVVAMKVPIHNAIATSLVAVIATSSTTTTKNVREGFANIRLGVTLETATVFGAMAGGSIAGLLPPHVLMLLFSATLVLLAVVMLRGSEAPSVPPAENGETGFVRRLAASYVDPATGETVHYSVKRLPFAMGMSSVAGAVSGLLGIGGGILKVPTLSLYCGVPIKAAAATSSFMIGVTAMASVVAYFGRGEVLPLVTASSVLGVMAGSQLGLFLSGKTHAAFLRRLFAAVMVLIATQMVWKVLH